MESSQQKTTRIALEHQLVEDLEVMRDALTKLSLLMHDLDFLVDGPRRKEALELATDCILRSQLKKH
jgi:hypothetical protein